MKWQQSTIYEAGWDSEGGRFRVTPLTGGVWLLIDFASNARDGGFFRKQFANPDQAKSCAEELRTMT